MYIFVYIRVPQITPETVGAERGRAPRGVGMVANCRQAVGIHHGCVGVCVFVYVCIY